MADKKPRAPKAPKAPATTAALVIEALKKAATKPGASWDRGQCRRAVQHEGAELPSRH